MRAKMILAGVIGLSVVVAAFFLLPNARMQPRPGSYRESVLRLLSTRNLEARDVEVADSCAPTVEHCYTYAGAVTVVAQSRLSGRIDCRERWTGCTLTLPGAALDREPLPDVIDPLAWRAQQLWYECLRWLRGAGQAPE
jgi:hypothetical protein